MSTKTKNFGWDKPAMSDTPGVTIPQIANNLEAIDAALTNVNSSLAEIMQQGINPLNPPSSLTACKGDGITDDSSALQAIINYCQTNNKTLISPAGITYGISTPLQITNTIHIDFEGSTIKALSSINSVITYNTNSQRSRIANLTIDCNQLTTYGIYITTIQASRFDNISILNVSGTGLYQNAGYELFASQFYIVGNGSTSTVGIHGYGDSHFNNIDIVDCFTAIYTTNFSFYSNVHAWLSGKGPIAGSMFMSGSGGGSFNQVYPDTYERAFAPNSNTNYLKISHAFVFCNPTIYTSAVTSTLPYLFYFTAVAQIPYVSISESMFIPLATSSGLTGGGNFMNQVLSQWTGQMAGTNNFSGIQGVPDFVTGQLTLASGWTASYNKLVKKNGRVRLILDAYYSSAIPQNSNINVVAPFDSTKGTSGFPEGFYPADSKKVIAMIGVQWGFNEVCYGYLSAATEHSTLQINYSGTSTTKTYISFDIEYDC